MKSVFFDIYTLVPKFHLAGMSNSSDAITANFVIAMFIILTLAAIYAFYRFIEVHLRISFYKNLLTGLSQEQLAEKREEIREKAMKSKLGNLWREFDESLVCSMDGKILSNTLDADHFFNEKSLARSLSGNRLLAAIPALLTGIGVLGTFAGLQLGLASLDLTAESDINILKSGIFSMMSGASTAFVTSVWGVGLSLLFNLMEKLLERNVRRKIAMFQDQIDFLFPRITTEQTLIRISDTSKITSQTMQTLAEQIGDRLQQSLMQASESIRQGMNENLLAVQQSMAAVSTNMREGLEKGMHEILKPAIESITQSAQSSSGEMVKTLVTQFMDGVNKAGSGQQEALEKAASTVQVAVEGMAVQMHSIMRNLETHGKAAQENSQQAIENIAQALESGQSAFEERSKSLHDEFTQQFSTVAKASSEAVEEMKTILAQMIDRNSEHQQTAETRFNDVVQTIESMLHTVANKSQEIDEQRFKTMEQQLNQITAAIEEKMSTVSQASAGAVTEIRSALTQAMEKALEQQQASEARFSEVVGTIESMMTSVSSKSMEIDAQRAESMEQQLGTLATALEDKIAGFEKVVSAISTQQDQRDSLRQTEFANSVSDMRKGQQELVDKLTELSTGFARVSDKMQKLAKAHENLSQNVLGASENLNTASVSLGTLGLNLNAASGKIENGATLLESGAKETSDVIKESTLLAKDLSKDLKMSLASIDYIEKQLSETAEHMTSAASASKDGYATIKNDLDTFTNGLLEISEKYAKSLDGHLQKVEMRTTKLFEDIIKEIRNNHETITANVYDRYKEFSNHVNELLDEFAQRTNTQVNDRLNQWNTHTSQYTSTMTTAITALSNVVDEIEGKVGKA